MLVFGHPQPGNPKSMTQIDATHRQRTFLIGICKEMISRMDPLRKAGLQGLEAEISLVTRKFSSSIFCWKTLHKIQEGESKNTKGEPWLQIVGASGKGLSPTLYSRVGLHWRTTHDAAVTAVTGVIVQILYTVNSHVSAQ